MTFPAEGQVVLLVPGLQGPRGATGSDPMDAMNALLQGMELPAVRQLLLRADPLPGPSGLHPEEMFFQLLALPRSEHGGWPMAALSRLAGHDDARDGFWLRADPVHLRPDMSKLLLLEPASLGLSLEDAWRLANHINGFSGDLGFGVEPDTATRWFAPLPSPPRMFASSPAAAHGQDAARNMPRGPDAEVWHHRMNLAQMLLHEAPANQQREEQGLVSVNSLWMWGAGTLPESPETHADLMVYADRSWAQGTARLLGGHGQPLIAPADEPATLAAGGPCVLLVEHFTECLRQLDPVAWREQLQEFDARWLQPLLSGLAGNRFRSLHLHLGGGTGLVLTRSMLRRWWTPPRWWRTSLPALMCRRLRGEPGLSEHPS